jgi:hypothetical protein
MREIFVTNRNDFHHSDRFNGVDFEFPPKERVAIPVEAAVHMFGFNMPDKTEVLTRLGWATKYDPRARTFVDDADGVKRLANFVFTKAVMIEAPIDAPDPEPMGLADAPAPPPVKAKRLDYLAVGNDEPLV